MGIVVGWAEVMYEDFLAHMRRIVAEQGWAVQGVERDRDHPPWAYTVGLTEHGLPELLGSRATRTRTASSP